MLWSWRKKLGPVESPTLGDTINGLPLPQELLSLIQAGRWRCPADPSRVDLVFPDRGELNLYPLEYMTLCNRDWPTVVGPRWLGATDPMITPGDIEPKLSVLIGDLGIGYDQSIALDYRLSIYAPRVLLLGYKGNNEVCWAQVAPGIQAFAALIGL